MNTNDDTTDATNDTNDDTTDATDSPVIGALPDASTVIGALPDASTVIGALHGSTTRAALKAHLEKQGVGGAALEVLLKDTAKARHAWRVERTIEAAKTWAIGVLGEDGGRACIHALACALLVADLRGPDPYWWVDRRCTIRHPALSGLGKGRVRASDGDAYIAAATEALEQLSSLYQGTAKHVIFEAKDGVVRVAIADIKPPVPYATINPADIGPIWAMTIAREGLRRAAGLNPVLLSDVKVYFDYRGGIEEWGRAVNGIVAEGLVNGNADGSAPSEGQP